MPRSDLAKLCDSLRITCTAVYGANKTSPNDFKGSHPYRVTLRKGRRTLSTDFFMGSAHTSEPTAADVLSCLCSDTFAGEQTFEDFCSELGYDPDSRKAERTWKTCRSMAPKVRRFLGDDFDRVARAEH